MPRRQSQVGMVPIYQKRKTFASVVISDENSIHHALEWTRQNVIKVGITLINIEVKCGCSHSLLSPKMPILGRAVQWVGRVEASPQGATIVTVVYSTEHRVYDSDYDVDVALFWSVTMYPQEFNEHLQTALERSVDYEGVDSADSEGPKKGLAQIISSSYSCGCSPGWYKGSGFLMATVEGALNLATVAARPWAATSAFRVGGSTFGVVTYMVKKSEKEKIKWSAFEKMIHQGFEHVFHQSEQATSDKAHASLVSTPVHPTGVSSLVDGPATPETPADVPSRSPRRSRKPKGKTRTPTTPTKKREKRNFQIRD